MGDKALTLKLAVSTYGRATKQKLGAAVVRGEPEDQLRAPIELLVADLAALSGLNRAKLAVVGESLIAEMRTRPDFAVTYERTLLGFIEIKAPGKGADPRKFRNAHDKDQWMKLRALPNLIYSDGNNFSLWRNGELVGNIVRLDGDVETSGSALTAPDTLVSLMSDFLRWSPLPPRTPKQLAEVSARLCWLLRAEVAEQLGRGDETLTGLAKDWRQLLFPGATDDEFADGYAQAVTFGLLLARAQGIPIDGGLDAAAKQLATHSFIGAAMRLLTDRVVREDTLATSARTLARVFAVVDWPTIAKGDPSAWLYFYEDFLAEYDNKLRKRTGSYYTPVPVVQAMTHLVDEALHHRFEMPDGFANSAVTVVDPATGTGTFLLEVLQSIAATVANDQGTGAVPAALKAALSRIIGFELQFGPFAVAQLRLLAELAAFGVSPVAASELRTFVTNTLGNPFIEEQTLGSWYEPIAKSRREANRIKRQEPVLVVIGNPPYKDKSHGKGGWIEVGNESASQEAPLAEFVPSPGWGVSAHVKHLYNPYVYFWRWATWKVFDHHRDADRGIVCFITVAGFLDGPGFQRMRDYLRRRADAIWVIDCSPEGHQPPVNTRIFQAVQQPVCITLVVRDGSTGPDTPAPAWFRQVPTGDRTQKFSSLAAMSLNDDEWQLCPDRWRAPFLPSGGTRWTSMPSLNDLMGYSGSGTMPGRTWIIAPDRETLQLRWDALVQAKLADKPLLMQEHPRDRNVNKILSDNLPGFPSKRIPISAEAGPCPEPMRIGYRSFDRQWIIPDKRLINQPNPTLWSVRSDRQIYLTALERTAPTSGPAITFSALVPDLDHYKGSFGGRAYPLWLDTDSIAANIVPGLLDHLSNSYARNIGGEDLFAYIAALLAHPGFVAMFATDLGTPGLRVPLTADPLLFIEAADVGRTVLWLHTYGQRCTDVAAGRPRRAPRLPQEKAPKVISGYPIPSDAARMPDVLAYDATLQELHVGGGRINNVTPLMRMYQVSGVNVLDKWFSYRRQNRSRPVIGDRRTSPLLGIQRDHWSAEYTKELIELLNVLGLLTELEPRQEDLLQRVAGDRLITVDELESLGVLPVPNSARKIAKRAGDDDSMSVLFLGHESM